MEQNLKAKVYKYDEYMNTKKNRVMYTNLKDMVLI